MTEKTMNQKTLFTNEELEVLYYVNLVGEAFNRLPEQRPNEKYDLNHALSTVQSIVLSRVGARELQQTKPQPETDNPNSQIIKPNTTIHTP